MRWLLFILITFTAIGAELIWDANDPDRLLGYRVYWGRATGFYDSVFDVGNVTNFTLINATGRVFYAVTAYDTDGLESEFSNEVIYDWPKLPPRAPTNLRLRGTNPVETIRLFQSPDAKAWRETGAAFVPVVSTNVFYQAANPAPLPAPKSFVTAKPAKVGKLTTRKPPRIVPPPPMPPK